MTFETFYSRYYRHPDKTLFRQIRIDPEQQARFIAAWHKYPGMSISALSRHAGISRPTAYRLIKLLKQRGEIRGKRSEQAG